MTVYLPGEVWRDHDGELWFVVACLGYDGLHMRNTCDVLAPADHVAGKHGPLTLVPLKEANER